MIRTVEETGSTNADLLADAAGGAPEGLWLRAVRQTGGRGRLGRGWVSPLGNLYASTIVRLAAGDPPPASLALLAAVAAHEAATAWLGDRGEPVRIKWPNDLMIGDAKMAGILLERSGDAVVAGFGINLAHAPHLPDRPVTSLADQGIVVEPATFLDDLAESLSRWLAIWRGRGLPAVIQQWLKVAHPIGTAIAANMADRRVEGLFAGLDAAGGLRLTLAGGDTMTIHAADVFLL